MTFHSEIWQGETHRVDRQFLDEIDPRWQNRIDYNSAPKEEFTEFDADNERFQKLPHDVHKMQSRRLVAFWFAAIVLFVATSTTSAQCRNGNCPPAMPQIIQRPVTTYEPQQVTIMRPVTTMQPYQLSGYSYSQRPTPILDAWKARLSRGSWQANYAPVTQPQQPQQEPQEQPRPRYRQEYEGPTAPQWNQQGTPQSRMQPLPARYRL